jgi:hypothetical protein
VELGAAHAEGILQILALSTTPAAKRRKKDHLYRAGWECHALVGKAF